MTLESASTLAIAVTGPAAAAITQNPELLGEATGASIMGALAMTVWRLAKVAAEHLKDANSHRELERAEWGRQETHRVLEREQWRSA